MTTASLTEAPPAAYSNDAMDAAEAGAAVVTPLRSDDPLERAGPRRGDDDDDNNNNHRDGGCGMRWSARALYKSCVTTDPANVPPQTLWVAMWGSLASLAVFCSCLVVLILQLQQQQRLSQQATEAATAAAAASPSASNASYGPGADPINYTAAQERWAGLRDRLNLTVVSADSPQAEALRYLCLLPPPVLRDEEQQYAIAVLFYEWGGPYWNLQRKDEFDPSIRWMPDPRALYGDGGDGRQDPGNGNATTINATAAAAGPSDRECSWMGIGCDDGGRIVSLNLTSFNAFSFPRGTIPTEIGMLAHLTALAVPEHGLQGSVPTELAALAGLREIDFRNNRLSSARSWLGALRRAPSGAAAAAPPRAVERVRLGFNGLRDEWGATELEGLAGLPSLVELDVENNPELSSPSSSDANVLEYAGAWPGLQVLSVGKTRLALPMSDQVSSWSNLRVLNADGVRLSGTLSPLLSTRIQALSLLPGTDAPGLGGALPTEIGLWTRLEELILDYNALSSTIPTEIGRAASIKTLSVQYNERLAGPIPTEVGLLRHLARLDLRTTSVSGTVPAELANCPDLVEMYVDTTDLVGGIPAALCDASREWVEFTASCLEGYFQCDCCTACFSS